MSGFEKNKKSKEEIAEILNEVKMGKSKSEVARKYNLDRSSIYYYLENNGLKNKRLKITVETITAIKEEVKDKTKTRQSIADKYGIKLSIVQYYSNRGIRRSKFKTYKDYLVEENKKRKEKGLYLFKPIIMSERRKKGL